MKNRLLKITLTAVSALLVVSIVIFALVWNGIIILNGISSYQYDIKGVDVSSYQGEIDWNVL
ncbi:MAG: glycoside hydrolase family 25, partial [Clostridia bacterium]|nr:glycoside hydrolase family 25 [Clostridia bacterium]